MTTKSDNPDPAAVIALRLEIQQSQGLGITAAQTVCATALHTSCRAWQQWENGDRKMHPAFWELAQIKLTAPGKPAKK